MSDYKMNPHTGKLDRVLSAEEISQLVSWKEPVSSQASLPLSGNTQGDARVANDTNAIYVWSIASPTGILADWVDVSAVSSTVWGDITGTLSDQTDLQNNLDVKYDELPPETLDTRLLLHLDGENGDTSTTDSSGNHIPSIISTTLTSAEKKFGTTSLELATGSNDRVSIPYSTDFEFFNNNDDFTMDWWFYQPDDASTIMMGIGTPTKNWEIIKSPGKLELRVTDTTTVFSLDANPGTSFGAWHHCAIIRVNGKWGIYVAGLQKDYVGSNPTITIGTGDLKIGTDQAGANGFNGKIDEFRITKGNLFNANPVFAQTDTITPPTEAGDVLNIDEKLALITQDGTDISRSPFTIQDIEDLQSSSAPGQTHVGTFTRDTSLASGSQVIVGLGFQPKAIILFAGQTATSEMSWGFSDAVTQIDWRDRHNVGANTYGVDNSACINLSQSGADGYSGVVSSMDSDGFTIQWTKVGSTSGIGNIHFLAIK